MLNGYLSEKSFTSLFLLGGRKNEAGSITPYPDSEYLGESDFDDSSSIEDGSDYSED